MNLGIIVFECIYGFISCADKVVMNLTIIAFAVSSYIIA